MNRFVQFIILVLLFPVFSVKGYSQDTPEKANVIFFTAGDMQDENLFHRTKEILAQENYTITDEDPDNLSLTAVPENKEYKMEINVSGYSVAVRTFMQEPPQTGKWTRVTNDPGNSRNLIKTWKEAMLFTESLSDQTGGVITTRSEPL